MDTVHHCSLFVGCVWSERAVSCVVWPRGQSRGGDRPFDDRPQPPASRLRWDVGEVSCGCTHRDAARHMAVDAGCLGHGTRETHRMRHGHSSGVLCGHVQRHDRCAATSGQLWRGASVPRPLVSAASMPARAARHAAKCACGDSAWEERIFQKQALGGDRLFGSDAVELPAAPSAHHTAGRTR